MKVVAMIKRSAGNESVGDMWTETKVFDITDSIESVYHWVASRTNRADMVDEITTNVTLSIAQEANSK
jgi:hypothetical protein